ncbi:MAG: MBL fold metallo-hydrolase [Actinomycetota bacterium]|nr:MBL fold metallo-hydrolase [Actinomycetota bacterium]
MPGFEKGLVELGDGVHAYLQPDGSWGWSNAGLVVGDGGSTLVDTLFDLHLTAEMLDTMKPLVADAPISTVVNTHANGDHCYGNQLFDGPGVAFVATDAAAHEMDELPPSAVAAIKAAAPPGPLGSFVEHAFGPFDFDGIEIPPITDTFSGRHTVAVGGRAVELIEVGPAHTAGDLLAWMPDERVLFAGDILFIGGTPIMWAGPVENWISACDLIEELAPRVVVPGHGPLTDPAGARDMGDYLRFVRDGVVERHRAGMTALDATRDLDTEINGTRFGSWDDRERLVVTVHGIWRDLEPDAPAPDVTTLFGHMADDFAARRR